MCEGLFGGGAPEIKPAPAPQAPTAPPTLKQTDGGLATQGASLQVLARKRTGLNSLRIDKAESTGINIPT